VVEVSLISNMAERLRPLADNANTTHLPSFKQRSQIREEEIYNPVDDVADHVDIPYARQWSPRPYEEYNPPISHISQAYTPSSYEEDNPPVRDIDQAYIPNPIPRFQRRGGEQNSMLRNVDIDPTHTPSTRQWSPKQENEYAPPVQDITLGYAPNARRLSRRRGEEHSPISRNVDASPMNTPVIRQWSPRPNEEYASPTHDTNTTYAPSIRQEPQSFATNSRRDSFRNSEDDKTAQEILNRNKEEKIEKRSSLSRMMMTKSKRTKFNQREIYRALLVVVNGQESVGPGVVEVLLEQFQAEHGNVNFVPQQKKSLGSVFKKRHEERSGLIEIAARGGNVDVVQLLSKNSDQTGLNNALEIAFRNRNAISNRNTAREDQMIRILVSKGADGSHTIGAAAAAGDETLLRMLLDGHPPVLALSEALPEAVAFREAEIRRRLTRMLLDRGADVNHSGGEAIFRATRLFDMHVLDMLLERRPHVPALSRAFASALTQPDSNSLPKIDPCWCNRRRGQQRSRNCSHD
jgi:hypothetical protein